MVRLNGLRKFDKSFWKGYEDLQFIFEKLLQRFSNQNLGFTFNNGKFEYKGKYLNGLTRKIDCKIGSIYEKKNLEGQTKKTRYYDDIIEKNALKFLDRGCTGCSSKLSPIEHGTLVDEQLYNHFCVPKIHLPTIEKYDECSIRTIDFLSGTGWEPLITQFAIFDKSRKLATSIDMICVSKKERRFKVIELKTSFSSVDSLAYEKNYNNKIIFQSFSNNQNSKTTTKRNVVGMPHTAYIHHQIQLLLSKTIFEKNYLSKQKISGNRTNKKEIEKAIENSYPFDYYLARVHNDGVTVYPLHPFKARQKQNILSLFSVRKRSNLSNKTKQKTKSKSTSTQKKTIQRGKGFQLLDKQRSKNKITNKPVKITKRTT